MTGAAQIMLLVLAVAGLATVVALGSPRTYSDRGVAWYLSATAWSALLFDGVLSLMSLGVVGGPWAAVAVLAGLALRGAVAVWLLAMVVQMRRRRP